MKRLKKESIVGLIDEHGLGVNSLLSSYDTAILEIDCSIDKLQWVLNNTQNENSQNSISNRILFEQDKMEKVLKSKDDLLGFLTKKQEQIKKLKERTTVQDMIRKDTISILKKDIEKAKKEIEAEKETMTNLDGFPDLQYELKETIDDLNTKLNEIMSDLDIKKSNKTYSTQLFDDISKESPELLESNFSFLSKYKLKETKNGNWYKINRFFDNTTGEEINDTFDLWVWINIHTNYFVEEINDKYLLIKTTDGHNHGDFILDKKTGMILWKKVWDSFENKWNNYIVIENNDVTKIGYSLCNISTWEIINKEKFKDIPIWFNDINGNDVLVFRDYNYTKVFFKSYPADENIWNEEGYEWNSVYKKWESYSDLKYIVDYNISNVDVNKAVFDKLKNISGIVQIVSHGKILLLDEKTMDSLWTITNNSSLFVSGDDIILSLEDSDGKWFSLYDITNKKELSHNIKSERFVFDSIVLFETKDNKNMIFDSKTKNIIDVPNDVSIWGLVDGYLSVSTSNNNYAIVDLKEGNILHLKDQWVAIKNMLTFDKWQNKDNVLLACEMGWKSVYAYIDLSDRTEKWWLKVDKFYQNKESKNNLIELSWWFMSKKLKIWKDWKIVK